MSHRVVRGTLGGLFLLAAAAVALLATGGCGEKIAMPHAEGLFSVDAYIAYGTYDDPGARRIVVANNLLYVVDAEGRLSKRNLNYDLLEQVEGLEDPTALSPDDDAELIFVWEEGARAINAYTSSDLTPVARAELPQLQGITRLAVCRTGVDETAPGARTFLYLAAPDSGVIHRYAWYEDGTAAPMGVLCRRDGLSVRFVHVPAGMAVDGEQRLLVCEADSLRNWVIRFDPTPDLEDTDPDWPVGPWRGTAVIFDQETCNPPTEADFVLGDARECGEQWSGGPSDAEGEFTAPQDVKVDGQGRIYVADTGNGRIQVFGPRGDYVFLFGDPVKTPRPVSLGVVDQRISSEKVNYGAYIFLISDEDGTVRKFISAEHYAYVNQEPPPPPS